MGFAVFSFFTLAEGHAKTLLRRSSGRKAGKREAVVEKKPGFVFFNPLAASSSKSRRAKKSGERESLFFPRPRPPQVRNQHLSFTLPSKVSRSSTLFSLSLLLAKGTSKEHSLPREKRKQTKERDGERKTRETELIFFFSFQIHVYK